MSARAVGPWVGIGTGSHQAQAEAASKSQAQHQYSGEPRQAPEAGQWAMWQGDGVQRPEAGPHSSVLFFAVPIFHASEYFLCPFLCPGCLVFPSSPGQLSIYKTQLIPQAGSSPLWASQHSLRLLSTFESSVIFFSITPTPATKSCLEKVRMNDCGWGLWLRVHSATLSAVSSVQALGTLR